jgi:mono/diheme cytochrome c family protein
MEFAPGHFFHIITMGKGKMPSYAAQLREQDRWKIVTYVYTTLQKRSEQPQTAKAGGSR